MIKIVYQNNFLDAIIMNVKFVLLIKIVTKYMEKINV